MLAEGRVASRSSLKNTFVACAAPKVPETPTSFCVAKRTGIGRFAEQMWPLVARRERGKMPQADQRAGREGDRVADVWCGGNKRLRGDGAAAGDSNLTIRPADVTRNAASLSR